MGMTWARLAMCESPFTDVAGQPVSLSFRGQEIQAERKKDFFTSEDGIYSLSQNVSKELRPYAV